MNFRKEDIEIMHVRSSGPGGQHRNKRWTGVRILHKPTGLVVTATERRSQHQNLNEGLRRLAERLDILLRPRKKRIAVKPPRSAVERRLSDKKRTADRKRARQESNE